METKQQLEKLYTDIEKIEEQIFVQRPSYDKTGLASFLVKLPRNLLREKNLIIVYA